MKKNVTFISTSLIGIAFMATAVFGYLQMKHSPEVTISEPMLAYDPADMRNVAGYFTDIFTARVVKKIGTEKKGIVMTQFSVEVLNVLKGDAKGIVTVNQPGGYYKGVWTIFSGDVGTGAKDADELTSGYLLETGRTYLLVARHPAGSNAYTLGMTPSERKLLDIDQSVNANEARTMLVNDSAVKAMEDAVANQIVPRRDRVTMPRDLHANVNSTIK